jgi:hypothetical protein
MFERAVGATARPATRLGEFSFAGRIGPLMVFAAVAVGMYLWTGFDRSLRLLLELCVAYLVPFTMLAGLARKEGPDPPWHHILMVAVLGAALGGGAAVAIAFAPDWNTVMTPPPQRMLREWELSAAFSAFFVGLALATAAVRQRERVEFETRQRLLEARLHMLAARIEPHFLMNTLANLRVLVKSDAAAAHAMLDHLADFLQGALERSRDLNSTLGHELQIVESYLAIMRIRLGDKLRFEIDVPQFVRDLPFPSLLLQTLVENSVTHGIAPGDRPGTVRISAREQPGSIVLMVADDGVGFDAQGKPGQGVGLRNVRDRLEAFYHGRASFTIGNAPAGGTEAVIGIPRAARGS